jgi:hypothetical protein
MFTRYFGGLRDKVGGLHCMFNNLQGYGTSGWGIRAQQGVDTVRSAALEAVDAPYVSA